MSLSIRPNARRDYPKDATHAAATIVSPLPAPADDTQNNDDDCVYNNPFLAWSLMTRTLAHYDILEKIGEGTYGFVYRARCRDTGKLVALKKMRLNNAGLSGIPQQLVREIKILKRLRHHNLLRMIEVVTSKGVEHLDSNQPSEQPPASSNTASVPLTTLATSSSMGYKNDYSSSAKKEKPSNNNNNSSSNANTEIDKVHEARERYKGNLFLVLEYVEHDLVGLMDVAYPFEPVQIKCIFRQLLQALAYMHEQKYIHRDIKSSNILLDAHFRLKLADFGLARSTEPPIMDQIRQSSTTSNGISSLDFTNKVITLWYRPPEILVGATQYGPAVDVWSAGCILAELLLNGKPLFTGKTEMEQLTLIWDMLGSPTKGTWDYLSSMKKAQTGEVTIDMSVPRPSRFRNKYSSKIPNAALNLIEKLLEWDPRKRLTAAHALENRYFWTQPVAPADPTELGTIQVGPGGHFHEFQTKKQRKQAKAVADKAKEKARHEGKPEDEVQEIFDQIYRGLMKKVAQEGLGVVTDEVTHNDSKPRDLASVVNPTQTPNASNLPPPLEERPDSRHSSSVGKSEEPRHRRSDEASGERRHRRRRDEDDSERRKRKHRKKRRDDERHGSGQKSPKDRHRDDHSRSSRDRRRHRDRSSRERPDRDFESRDRTRVDALDEFDREVLPPSGYILDKASHDAPVISNRSLTTGWPTAGPSEPGLEKEPKKTGSFGVWGDTANAPRSFESADGLEKEPKRTERSPVWGDTANAPRFSGHADGLEKEPEKRIRYGVWGDTANAPRSFESAVEESTHANESAIFPQLRWSSRVQPVDSNNSPVDDIQLAIRKSTSPSEPGRLDVNRSNDNRPIADRNTKHHYRQGDDESHRRNIRHRDPGRHLRRDRSHDSQDRRRGGDRRRDDRMPLRHDDRGIYGPDIGHDLNDRNRFGPPPMDRRHNVGPPPVVRNDMRGDFGRDSGPDNRPRRDDSRDSGPDYYGRRDNGDDYRRDERRRRRDLPRDRRR